MNCTEPRPLVHAHLDHELDLEKSLEMESHLRECSTCSLAYEQGRRLRAALNDGELRFSAPAHLRERVDALARRQARPRSSPAWWRGAAFAASAALAALAVFAIVPRGASTGDSIVDEIVSSHVRSLMADHLTDVPSSDRHTVKPWFDGKLDFAPAVADLADHGFPLVGGRLDYARNRPTAALVYARQKHFINLFVWPAAQQKDGNPGQWSRHGFNVVHWNGHEMSYWAVSDLNTAELEEFAGLIRERTTTPTP